MRSFNLPYRYAQRSTGATRDYIHFAAQDPAADEFRLKRKRIYIDHIKDKRTRDRHAKKLIEHVNTLLDAGKNPFVDQENNKKYTTIIKALDFVMDFKSLYIRSRSKQSFESRIGIFKAWLRKKKLHDKYIFEFSDDMALAYMGDLIRERKITGRTYNNYLLDYRTFFNTLIKHKYIAFNPFRAVEKLPEQDVDKRPFRPEEAQVYFEWLEENDPNFKTISLYCYYLALRPAEICRLKISDFWLTRGLVVVPAGKSKNKKKRIIPIAKPLLDELRVLFKDKPQGLYICGKDFEPGMNSRYPTRIAERFRVIAEPLQIPTEVKFYSLKDTAADALLEKGYTIKDIRDLFGHSSIAATDAYLKKFRTMVNQDLIDNFPEP